MTTAASQEKAREIAHAIKFCRTTATGCKALPHYAGCKIATDLIAAALDREREEALEEAADEVEKAFDEADTLNLLHGAARIRALAAKPREAGA